MSEEERIYVDDYRPYELHLLSRTKEIERASRKETGPRFWDRFYSEKGRKFFKDRHYLTSEFQEISNEYTRGIKTVLLEVGCGNGATAYAVMEQNPDLFVCGCDVSSQARKLYKNDPRYAKEKTLAFVHNIVNGPISSEEMNGMTADAATFVFVLSALREEDMEQSIINVSHALRGGAFVYVRDYAVGDLKMSSFLQTDVDDDQQIRGDGTRCHFFTEDSLISLFVNTGIYKALRSRVIEREVINHKLNLHMDRKWVECVFQVNHKS